MIKEKDLQIIIDPLKYANRVVKDIDIEFNITDDEKSYFPNLVSLNDTKITLSIMGSDSIFTLDLKVLGNITLIDAHTQKEINYPLEDNVQLNIDIKGESDVDVINGKYDLRGAILALLYNSIPLNYSKTKLTRIQTDDYILMSEEEYEKERSKNNPFSELDNYKFE